MVGAARGPEVPAPPSEDNESASRLAFALDILPAPADSAAEPTTDVALLALSARYAASPDIPVSVAAKEIASLARLARSEQERFTAIGLDADRIATLARFGRRLEELEKAWGSARSGVKLTAAQKKLRAEAEALTASSGPATSWPRRSAREAAMPSAESR